LANSDEKAEALIRLLHREHIKEKGLSSIRRCLERLADLEDVLDRVSLRQSNKRWQSATVRHAV
jgi:hypothetical protein